MCAEIDASGSELPLFFVSTARRARETFDGLNVGSASLSQQAPTYDGALYTFDEADLIDWIAAADDDLDSIAIIGHNPAMTDLANFLCPPLMLSNLPCLLHTQVREIAVKGSSPRSIDLCLGRGSTEHATLMQGLAGPFANVSFAYQDQGR